MPTNEESSFVSPLYLVDTFEELQDLRYSDLATIDEYRELKMKKNDGIAVDEIRLAELELIFQNKIVTSSRWNKFQNALLGMQNFIKTEVQDYVVDKQTEMEIFVTTKEAEFQTEINKFTDKGTFNPDILYYKNNFVSYNDGTGIKTYLAIQNPPLGTLPTNTTYFRLLTITGQKGEDGVGIGLTFKGAWNNSTVYAKDWGVQFGGLLFASLIDNNVGNQPDINGDTAAWGVALDVTITTTKLRGQRTIASESNTVNFITGEIIAFNPSIDDLEVIVNTTSVERGIDYTINIDNQSITKASGTWVAGTTFYFRVIRNMINNLVFGDGQSISEGTVTKNKLSTDVQTTLDVVAENTIKISVLNGIGEIVEKANKSALDTTNTNVTNLSNTVVSHLADYAHHYKKDAGSSDAYVVALNPTITSYTEGMTLDIFCKTANTGAATLDAGGGAKDLRKYYNDALETGDIEAGAIITVKWDSANDWWQVTSGIKVTVNDASDTAKGIIEIATDAEMTEGTATDKAITPANAKVELDKKAKVVSGSYSGNETARTISLAFTPKFFMLTRSTNADLFFCNTTSFTIKVANGGTVTKDTGCKITTNGISLSATTEANSNSNTYYYTITG